MLKLPTPEVLPQRDSETINEWMGRRIQYARRKKLAEVRAALETMPRMVSTHGRNLGINDALTALTELVEDVMGA